MAQGIGTIVVWGDEAEKTRYISINGESTVQTLLQAVTGATINHLSFLDPNGTRFGDVNLDTKVNQIGEWDQKQQLWTVIIKPKEVCFAHNTVPLNYVDTTYQFSEQQIQIMTINTMMMRME